MAENSSSQNRDSELGLSASSIAQKRKMWFKLGPILLFVNTIALIIYGFVQNDTEVFINIGYSWLGVLLSHFLGRLFYFFEGLLRLNSEYKGSLEKLWGERFISGNSWKPCLLAFLSGLFICLLIGKFTKNTLIDLNNGLSLLSGISVGPLVVYLLQLNAQSDVELSNLLKKKGLHPAYILVWNYYINYLENALLEFNRHFFSRSSPMQVQASNECSDQDTESITELSLKRLILLFSDNYKKEVDLIDLDSHIISKTDKCVAGYNFPVYGLKYSTCEYKFVILFAEEPLQFIQKFPHDKERNFVHSELFHETLVSEIFSKDNNFCRSKCIPILIPEIQSLDNGGLVELIMNHVRTEECVPVSNTSDDTELRPLSSTEQPQEPDRLDDTQGLSQEAEATSNQHAVGQIDDAESYLRCNPYPSLRNRSNPSISKIIWGSLADMALAVNEATTSRNQDRVDIENKSDDSATHNLLNFETSSAILKGKIKLIKQLQKWLEDIVKKYEWSICYRASRDGWSAQAFHRRCDNKGPTVVLVKANDCIFGGYTDQHWDSSYTLKHSNSSFLFSLRNNDNLAPFISNIEQRQEQYAIHCHADYGPIFGGGPDLHIYNNSQVNNQSRSNFGGTYQLPPGYVFESEQAKNLLAGQEFFISTEIEVFN